MVSFLLIFAFILQVDGSIYTAILAPSPLLVIAGAFPLIYCRIRYIVTEDELIIKFPGLSDEHISLDSIVSLKRVYGVVTAKALSTDRIEIMTRENKCIHISPDDPEKFIGIVDGRIGCF